MPLVQCPDCRRDISLEAASCPNCGRPMAMQATPPESSASASLPLLIGTTGSAVLFLGAFAPIISIPLAGPQNYFQNGAGDGVIIAILAVASAVITLVRKFRLLWLTGLAALAVLAFTFVTFQLRMAEMREEMQRELAGNPFVGLGELALQSVQLQWGWAVLVVGSITICATAFIGSKR